jgi:hypothetical protein
MASQGVTFIFTAHYFIAGAATDGLTGYSFITVFFHDGKRR